MTATDGAPMNTDERKSNLLIGVHRCSSVAILFVLAVAGCSKPDKANIALRKQVQDLESEISNLKRTRDADLAAIRALESRATTIPTLPHDRLEQVFTTHGLKIGRLTGGADADPSKQGDEVLKVYAVPTDQRGDLLKAAGSFAVDAYDL